MKTAIRFIAVMALPAILFSCRETYTPPQITANSNYLVVEGLINTGTDSTIFKLSRTVKLNAKTTTQAETHAVVTVESDANAVYTLKEITPGTYASAPLGLSNTAKYRLRIITNTNNHTTYLSDFVPVKNSPPIDSVGYTLQPNGVQIYASSHDATNNTRYYRWGFTETWVYQSLYNAQFIALNNHIALRTLTQSVYSCWQSANSTDITLASSAKLTQDVMYQAPITLVPSSSVKLSSKYSILVKQYALTEDAFNFWQLLKKNTEQLGSIFDAQPSSITGNIHNIADNTEPVLGYISAGTVQQKRIFIGITALPLGWGKDSPFNACLPNYDPPPGNPYNPVAVYKMDYANYFYPSLGTTPETYLYIPINVQNETPTGDTIFTAAPVQCVDCRTAGGTLTKPSFWQ